MKLLKNYFELGAGLSLFVLISGAFVIGVQEQGISNAQGGQTIIPTTNWHNTSLPDWNQITFAKMPGIAESGSFEAPTDVVEQLGYDPFRSWTAGQPPDSFMMLGDFQDSFQLQQFSLTDIAKIVEMDLSQINLESFGIMKNQTLSSLVNAIPELQELPIAEVKPIFDLLSQELATSFEETQTIGQLLQQSPHLGQLEFASLQKEPYSLDSIPGLLTTPLGAFENWQGIYINEIPGLANVPFSQFPNPINSVGADVGIVDIAFGPDEQQRERTISGSDQEGFNVKCEKDCAHIELSGSAKILGKQWISGKYQQVRGGKGILGSVNGGREPTGRHPFGDAFKVAVWDVSETDGMVSQALFFRFCMRKSFVDLGCTPYFVGPVPWISYREMDSIFLGSVTEESSNSISTPTGYKSSGFSLKKNGQSSQFQSASKADCSKQHRGVVVDALSAALSDIEGNYDSVGTMVCDRSGNCGRGLGAMQFMSYRPDVRSLISSKSGGSEFLAKLDKGQTVTGAEMMQYFSPAEQQILFASDLAKLLESASQQIDPTTKQPFTGTRLIERTAQIHFGRVGIPVDAAVSDVKENLSVKEYGKKAASEYSQFLQSMGCL